MIVEVTYEGNGIFKVWPPPGTEAEVREIIGRVLKQDPLNRAFVDETFLGRFDNSRSAK